MARVAVRIATGDDPRPGGSPGLEQPAVTDPLTRPDLLDSEDTAVQGHHRLKIEARRIAFGKGTAAVEHDAWAHPVVRRLRITKNGG